MSTSAPTIIQTRQLSKRFGEREVLKGIDLSIPQGAIVGLLGTNGSGKSTLIKCLLGLLQITSGSATIFGEDVWDLSAESKARLGYVPQDVRLYPWMRARQVIAYTAAFYPRWDHALTSRLLDEWALSPEELVSTASPGQLQKLALILALGHRPELLILDEPVASLDPLARREFLKSLLTIAEDERHTVLFSTHITSDLERVASHVAIMKDGQIGFFGELDTLKDSVKRLRFTTEASIPVEFLISGALRTEVEGNRALVVVSDYQTDTIEALKSKWNAEIKVEDLNLEDIFLELHHI